MIDSMDLLTSPSITAIMKQIKGINGVVQIRYYPEIRPNAVAENGSDAITVVALVPKLGEAENTVYTKIMSVLPASVYNSTDNSVIQHYIATVNTGIQNYLAGNAENLKYSYTDLG